MNNLNDIFFTPASNQSMTYNQILEDVQRYFSENHASTIAEAGGESNGERAAALLKELMVQYLVKRKYTIEGLTTEQLCEQLYEDMAGYSFLKKWIYKPGIEEVNINAYNDIEVIEAGGRSIKIPDKFSSPQHAIDVVRRMLNACGMIIDDSGLAGTGGAGNAHADAISDTGFEKMQHFLGGASGIQQLLLGDGLLVDDTDAGVDAHLRVHNRRLVHRNADVLVQKSHHTGHGSGWRSPHQSYMTLQRPLWIIAEDPAAGKRIWITHERAKLSITVGPMDEHGHNYGHARMIFCRNQTELVSELNRLFADTAATA